MSASAILFSGKKVCDRDHQHARRSHTGGQAVRSSEFRSYSRVRFTCSRKSAHLFDEFFLLFLLTWPKWCRGIRARITRTTPSGIRNAWKSWSRF